MAFKTKDQYQQKINIRAICFTPIFEDVITASQHFYYFYSFLEKQYLSII